MNTSLIAGISLILLLLAYRFYARYLCNGVFRNIIDDNDLPAHRFRDDIDFVPTRKPVLFGHHFSSIAGAAPILGPAIAIIWGWLPAILWIVFGSVFIGAVHDYGSLVLSSRFGGSSIGSITGDILGKRARFLFLFIIFLLVFVVISVFAYIIAVLFVNYPGSVIPINFEILVALVIGYLVKRKNIPLFWPSFIALLLLYGMIYIGYLFPVEIPEKYAFASSPLLTWVLFLMVYGYVAAVLPVTVLLQPRDYINSHQMILGLILVYTGLFMASRPMVAPALNISDTDASWFPLLFITIACGAISGFHSLVSTGTTSKQLEKLGDAKLIGYGSMLGEASLAIAATLAVASGFESRGQWLQHYASFEGAEGMSSKLTAFVAGTSAFLEPLLTPFSAQLESMNALAAVFISVLVISFAATSLDTAVRIQRYVIGELAKGFKLPFAENRFINAAWAILFSLLLVLSNSGGSGGLYLWPLFGTTNQLLGALTLMLITVWLFLERRNFWITLIPLVILLIIVTLAALVSIGSYWTSGNYLLTAVALAVIACHIWLLLEGMKFVISRFSNSGRSTEEVSAGRF